MFTSDNFYGRTAFAYLVASIACALAGAVYEHFSFGVYSPFMVYAFLVPLVGGTLVFALLGRARNAGRIAPSLWANRLYGGAIATWTAGCLVQGALEIYGTTNSLVIAYFVAGLALMGASVGLCLSRKAATR